MRQNRNALREALPALRALVISGAVVSLAWGCMPGSKSTHLWGSGGAVPPSGSGDGCPWRFFEEQDAWDTGDYDHGWYEDTGADSRTEPPEVMADVVSDLPADLPADIVLDTAADLGPDTAVDAVLDVLPDALNDAALDAADAVEPDVPTDSATQDVPADVQADVPAEVADTP